MERYATLITLLGLTMWGIHEVNAMTSQGPLCTRKCTMLDDTTDCWKQSLDHYADQVQKSLRNYAALVTHVNRWRENLPEKPKAGINDELETFEESSLNRTLERFSEWDEEEQAPLGEVDLRAIFSILLNRTKQNVDAYVDPAVLPPPVSCPVACDYYPQVWSILSYTLIACLILCCLIFFLHTCYMSRRFDRRLTKV